MGKKKKNKANGPIAGDQTTIEEVTKESIVNREPSNNTLKTNTNSVLQSGVSITLKSKIAKEDTSVDAIIGAPVKYKIVKKPADGEESPIVFKSIHQARSEELEQSPILTFDDLLESLNCDLQNTVIAVGTTSVQAADKDKEKRVKRAEKRKRVKELKRLKKQQLTTDLDATDKNTEELDRLSDEKETKRKLRQEKGKLKKQETPMAGKAKIKILSKLDPSPQLPSTQIPSNLQITENTSCEKLSMKALNKARKLIHEESTDNDGGLLGKAVKIKILS